MLWIGASLAGLWVLLRHEYQPGPIAAASTSWPKESRIGRKSGRPTLVMFAHSHCPCTRASLGELALILSHCPGMVDAHVVFFKPSSAKENIRETPIGRLAADTPGVTLMSDEEGVEARLFRARTSGYSLLYDAEGRLQFCGGITGSRGHSGDNSGRSAVEAFLRQGTTDTHETAVFGCPLSR